MGGIPRGSWHDVRPGASGNGAGSPPGGQEIRAEVIAELLLGAREPAAGSHPAVRLRGGAGHRAGWA